MKKIDDVVYFRRRMESRKRNKKIFRILCCAFALFMMSLFVMSYYEIGFHQEGKIFFFRDRDFYNGFFILRGKYGIELWETGLNRYGWVSEYRIFP